MSPYRMADIYSGFAVKQYIKGVQASMVRQTLINSSQEPLDFLNLISPAAEEFIEELAFKSQSLTVRQFGRTIKLYAPLYISNYCTNHCIYCGFNVKNRIVRKKLSLAEIKIEAEKIFNSGIRDIVILTGESGLDEEFNLIKESIEICRKYFDRISLEVFPMSEDQYRILFDAGADGVTVYQETYDRDVYRKVHPAGLKSNFEWRLETVDRAALAGARHIGIGALLGLSDPYYDLLQLVLHAGYILRRYPSIELSLSLPRIHSEIDKKSVVQADTNDTGYKPEWTVSDHLFVQAVCAMRVVLPTVGITLSTRESCEFRNGVIPLGVTRCSAGSRTEVGGYSQPDADNEQFKISDRRGIDLMAEHIKSIGYDPVFLDRERF